MKRKCLAGALAIAAVLLMGKAPVYAHGAVVSQDTCILFIGPNKMKFSGYQPNTRGSTKFCDDVPDTGKTVIVLDFVDPALRLMDIGVKFVTNVNLKGDPAQDGETVFELTPRVYTGGTMRIDHTFPAEGFFVGIVTGRTPQGEEYIARFPFGVGKFSIFKSPMFSNVSGLLMLLGMLLAGSGLAAYVLSDRDKDRSSTMKN